MADPDLKIPIDLTVEGLHKELLRLQEENRKTMATIKANSSTEPTEQFSLSELDYDELLEVYGDDPVLMTIFNRMRDFFRHPVGSPEGWYRIKDWPGSSPYITEDPNDYFRWGIADHTTIATTSKVSDSFTLKTDSTGKYYTTKDVSIKYSVE